MYARNTIFALAAAVGSAKAQSAGCGLDPVEGGSKTIDVGGQAREYTLTVPQGYDPNTPHRLVFGFHGLYGNMGETVSGGHFGLEPLSEGTTVFIAPQGLDEGSGTGWPNPGGRDVSFVDAIVDSVTSELCIDEAQVFATGFSYGGGMSYALACARPDVFRAVAPIAGAQLSGCDGGSTPIAYLGIHGVVDSVLSFDQGEGLRDNYLQVNGCAAKDAPAPQPGGAYIRTDYECSEGFPVSWIAHGGDHIPNPEGVAAEAWAFFAEAWAFFTETV